MDRNATLAEEADSSRGCVSPKVYIDFEQTAKQCDPAVLALALQALCLRLHSDGFVVLIQPSKIFYPRYPPSGIPELVYQ